jgi:hypothetical protein
MHAIAADALEITARFLDCRISRPNLGRPPVAADVRVVSEIA